MAGLGRVLRATQGKQYRYAFVLQFAPGMGTKCVAHGSCARRLVATARCGREPGESAAAKPLVAAPFDLSLRGTLTAVAPRGRRGRCARGGASPILAYMVAIPSRESNCQEKIYRCTSEREPLKAPKIFCGRSRVRCLATTTAHRSGRCLSTVRA